LGLSGRTTAAEPAGYFEEGCGWWAGGGDVLVDEFEDLASLVQPPEEEIDDSLASAFVATAQQVLKKGDNS
jgi:hypothetical protein